MNTRINAELEYEWRLQNFLGRDSRLRKIFPEAIRAGGLEEQPFAVAGTKGISSALNAENVLVVTGPCLLPGKDVKAAISAANQKIENTISDGEFIKMINQIAECQPSLQNVANICIAVDNTEKSTRDVVSVMETYEVALLFANNNKSLFDRFGNELLEISTSIAKRIEKMMNNYRKLRGIKSKIFFYYTHEPREKGIYEKILERLDRDSIKPRAGSFFEPESWQSTSKTRVELAYTTLFTNELQDYLGKKYDAVVLGENYKHFYQIFDGSFVLPLEFFGVGREHNLLALMALPSLRGEGQMDFSGPFYIGQKSIDDIKKQFGGLNPKDYLKSLGLYLMALLPARSINKRDFTLLMNTIFKTKQKFVKTEEVADETIKLFINEVEKLRSGT